MSRNETVTDRLYQRFYANGPSVSGEASSHWKAFSDKFEVERDENGNVSRIKGYGFGGSEEKRLLARSLAKAGNALNNYSLGFKGLASYLKQAKKTVADMGLFFSQDAMRQACTAFFLAGELEKAHAEPSNILIIGDGHGILSALLHRQYPAARIILADLGVTLFFQAYYLGRMLPDAGHWLAGEDHYGKGFVYCSAEDLGSLPDVDIDLAINIASMQEMNHATIAEYFRLLREHNTSLFYCCNRLSKTLPGGEQINFFEYPWLTNDRHYVDGPCPWHRFFVGLSSARHVKLAGLIPVPLLHKYDGVHWHRLTALAKQE